MWRCFSLKLMIMLMTTAKVMATTLQGTVTDETDSPLPGVTVKVAGTGIGTVTDKNGFFLIDNLDNGSYTLEVSFVGYEKTTRRISVRENKNSSLNFKLLPSSSQLDEVVVYGQTEAAALSAKPVQITSIDVRKLQSESADVVNILDRSSGVRVRQSGGLGSNTTVQLNGLTGRAVRIYYDGVPLELLGGVQINNLPVNNIERVDVYKGVMPIDVGTDALAGGINVISRKAYYDYLDVTYQVGSFNTHVATLNASKKLSDYFVASFSGFINYSDNNYRIRANQRTPDFREVEVEVDRFHSAHQSSMIQGSLGLIKTRWADKLLYGIGYNQRFDEIQHGVRLGNNAVGEADIERNALIQNLKYEKSFLGGKFDIDYFVNYSISKEFVDDSTTNVYNWFGEIVANNEQGNEVLSDPSLREGRTEAHVHRLNLNYNLHQNHRIKLSSFLSDETVKGSDPLAFRINDIDPNTVPSFLTRSITGISYESEWFNARLETILFGKYYYYDQSTADFNQQGGGTVSEFAQDGNETGFGMGLKFNILPDFYIRSSYEQAIRIPTRDEVFGNFITIAPNFLLRPEESKNLNLGSYYKHTFNSHQFVSLDLNWFLRDQSELIRLRAGRNENDPAVFINEEEADATGVEITLKAAPIKNLELTGNITFQEVVRDGEVNATNTNGIGNPIPNIPFTFYNLSARYKFASPLSENDRVSVFSYYTFVEDFDLIFQGATRIEENIIPTQRQLDFGVSYDYERAGLTFSLQTNNVLNTEVFDNYRIPKPGRNFNFKIRYQIRNL